MKRIVLFLALLIGVNVAFANAQSQQLVEADSLEPSLVIENAWVRETPPVATTAAAYMQITNTGNEAVKIVSVHSDAAEHNEIHTMYFEDDIMHMDKLPVLLIESGETTTLAPGGLHIMLMQLHSGLREGDFVNLLLKTAAGKSIEVTAPVKRAQ